MSRKVKLFVQVCLLLISCFLSYRLAYYICETYFFDKVFYQKSVAFGYSIRGKNLTMPDYGRRSYDVIPLHDASLISKIPAWYRASVSDKSLEHTFTIAMIGDSYVWGQGVRFSDSMSQVLERKLNSIRKTKILSIAAGGDDLVDNYSKYAYLQDKHIDLFIFVIVSNDLVFNKPREYLNDRDSEIYDSLIKACMSETGVPATTVRFTNIQKSNEYLTQIFLASYANPTNICVLHAVAALLPKEKAIYFIPDDVAYDTHLYDFTSVLKNNNLFVLPSTIAKTMPEYASYFHDSDVYFHVSSLDPHPSVLAHRMYADILFREITSSPQLGFIKR